MMESEKGHRWKVLKIEEKQVLQESLERKEQYSRFNVVSLEREPRMRAKYNVEPFHFIVSGIFFCSVGFIGIGGCEIQIPFG